MKWNVINLLATMLYKRNINNNNNNNNNNVLLGNWKKLWNLKGDILSIVIYAFGTVTKGLLKGLVDLEVG